jgi:hypothetical protein
MQRTSTPEWKNTHDTFWHEDQVVISFYFEEALTASNKAAMYEKLHQYRLSLNRFLQSHGLKLDYLGEEAPQIEEVSIPQSNLPVNANTRGVHLFGLQTHVEPAFSMSEQAKQIQTGVVSLFQLAVTDPARSISADSVAELVNLINDNLDKLNSTEGDGHGIQVLAASPHMYCGATQVQPGHVIQGCPAGPPVPVPIGAECQSSPGFWPIELASNDKIGTGKGVTVFVLDSLPKRKEITKAAKEAGEKNKLLLDVNKRVTFRYQFDDLVDALDKSGQGEFSVAKDIYGRHVNFRLPDHGLFIAGIVHSIAPDAKIECIRVLNDYCVGDTNVLFGALRYIHNRMSEINPDTNQPGDLYKKPVVINLSLVIPTDEEAELLGVKTSSKKNLLRTDMLAAIQSLVGLGAVFAASAGNEGDNPMNPAGQIPDALYPAAFANDKVKGIISVGATNRADKVAKYSNFPGPLGIATYGGEIPKAIPSKPPKHPGANGRITKLKAIDALLGIYSSRTYPSLSMDENGTYPAPDNNDWAYWYGTSFSTPIISAILACSLEKNWPDNNQPLLDYLLNVVPGATRPVRWKNLFSRKHSHQDFVGRMIQVKQSKPAEQSNGVQEEMMSKKQK